MIDRTPNQSPEPTPLATAALRLSLRAHSAAVPTWLSFWSLGRSIVRNTIPIVLVAAAVLAGCSSTSSVRTQTAAPTTAATAKKGGREGLEFLADIPSLKDVSLKMTEAEFVDILHQQKLDSKRDVSAGQTTYSVEPAAHVIVLFMFREDHCSGIQRL